MSKQLPLWRRYRVSFLKGLAFPVLLASPFVVHAAEPPTGLPQEAPAAALAREARALDLSECRLIALGSQPTLAAHHASVASALAAQEALEKLRVPTFLRPDLPIRRKQAAIGVNAAQAGLEQAKWEALYAVTRNYFTVQYARAQRKVADEVVEQLDLGAKKVEAALAAGERQVSRKDLLTIQVYLSQARQRQSEAVRGIERATAALREAMGIGPDCALRLANDGLAAPQLAADRDEVIRLALARRGEMILAASAAELADLEICAQGATRGAKAMTFAAVADIHARPIPQGVSNGEYRPGAIGLEMPTTLVGNQHSRQDRARALSARAAAVVEKSRNLIALEAEDTYLKWQDAKRRSELAEKAARDAQGVVEAARGDFRNEFKGGVDRWVQSEVLAEQARAARNTAVYQHLLALTALERVTAGGFTECPAADAGTQVAPGTENK